MQKLETISELISKAEEISRGDFSKIVNQRSYELDVAHISELINIETIPMALIRENITKYYNLDKPLSFTLFYILYTKVRRLKLNLKELTDEYLPSFEEYEITKFLQVLSDYNESKSDYSLKRNLKIMESLIEKKTQDYDFTNHSGMINLFVEIVCVYYEQNMDKRDESKFHELSQKALKKINIIISQENNAYSKFYLNKGRILLLMGKYSSGEEYINKAIKSINVSPDRDRIVREYEQYLVKSSILRAYDLTNDKIKELDQVKVNNFKSLALMTTLLGFLLGTINIFIYCETPFSLAMMMLCYLALLMVLISVVLLGLNLSLEGHKKKFFIYDILILVVGIVIFTISILIVLKYGVNYEI